MKTKNVMKKNEKKEKKNEKRRKKFKKYEKKSFKKNETKMKKKLNRMNPIDIYSQNVGSLYPIQVNIAKSYILKYIYKLDIGYVLPPFKEYTSLGGFL